MAALDLDKVRARFPALAQAPGVVHADAPGGTQVVDRALAAMHDYLVGSNANQDGVFAASQRTDELCEEVRRAVGAFVGGPADGVVFGPNMTTLTWHFAHAFAARLRAANEIVCTRLDHDANVAPWLQVAERRGAAVRWVKLDADSGTLDLASLERAVTNRTSLIAFPRASNALGTVVDPQPFVAAAQAVGAVTFMDAVHAAPHVALDRAGNGVDVLVCSPYKFFGPHAGVLSADPELLASLAPDKVRAAPDTGPQRWQTGTASFEAIAGTGAAVGYLHDTGMDPIREHERELSRRFLDGLGDLPHVRLHGPPGAESRTPTFAVTVARHTPQQVALALAARDIRVWDGHYYALEPMRALGLLDRGGAVRIGFVHYHGADDVDRVLEALADLA